MSLRTHATSLLRTVARALLAATGRTRTPHDDDYEAWLTETFAR